MSGVGSTTWAENVIALRELSEKMDGFAAASAARTDFHISSNAAVHDQCAALAADGKLRWVGPISLVAVNLKRGDQVVLSPKNYDHLRQIAA